MSLNRQIHIKNKNELRLMRQAGKVNAIALLEVSNRIQPGVTTMELDRVAEEVILSYGGKPIFKGYPGPYPFPSSLTISINEELVHGIPSDRRLKEGEIVSIDCGTLLNGYVADSAFTMGVGVISERAMKIISVTEEALRIGISNMQLGNKTGDISSAIQQFIESNGYHVTREYTGHGVGKKMHEGPQVPNYGERGNGIPLRAGMTIALEPMVLEYTPKTRVMNDKWTVVSLDGSLTAHFEHTVAVTDSEPLVLTILPMVKDDLELLSRRK